MSRWTPAYVALGSNLNEPRAQLVSALRAIKALPQVAALIPSAFYASVPLGGKVQPNFVNAVAGFLTSLDASSLLATLKSIEVAQGRERGAELWASRTLDLDLLAHGQTRSATPELTLPHAGIVGRNFVLYPLAEIAPDLILPGLGRVRELRDALPPTGLTRLD